MWAEADINNALLSRLGEENFKKLKNARVAVCGLGGLGSNIAMMLCRSGVGNLLLIDFDKVDMTNINRQNYYLKHIDKYKTEATKELLKEINPYANIKIKTERITEKNAEELLLGYDIICEAFDLPENKAMLTNTLLPLGKTLVCGSGMAGYSDSNTIQTKKISDRFYICGDFKSDSKDTALMSPRVTICAAHQANMVINILIKEKNNE